MKKNNLVFWLIGLGSMAFMSFVLWRNYVYASNLGKDYQGLFGDMFGASNALFTGLSFVGVIIAILLQRQDINNQKEDTKIQNFEAIFFNLLKLHRETVVSLEKTYKKLVQKGVQRTTEEYNVKGVQLMGRIYGEYLEALPEDKKFNRQVYHYIYKQNWDVLGHYYRGIQSILDYVDRFKLSTNKEFYYKKLYFDLIKSQLSEYETAMIFYHFLYLEDRHYKCLAEMNCLFEYINEELVTNDKELYEKYAFVF
ncbi:putative phage abortive infection protein [Chryseobacterium cucumeris]|uniref:putative phage abortive infection protein n=1 Tax=Chryseobacterium cucumeris TaxID=1813611 RepID=UPI00192DD85B|nr:putative phage abortive infection protein [Chryseobacterium cucumeris]QRA44308.1 hypothetical protein JNG87_06020 [Chryseobacterium cucumeris]